MYTQQQLIDFGNYILDKGSIEEVTDVDIANFFGKDNGKRYFLVSMFGSDKTGQQYRCTSWEIINGGFINYEEIMAANNFDSMVILNVLEISKKDYDEYNKPYSK
mgnify:CR=1 FL=1